MPTISSKCWPPLKSMRRPSPRRRRSCRPTGCRRSRWCGGGRASPPCGPCGGAGRGSCRGCRRDRHWSKYRQTVLLGGKSTGRYAPLAAGAEDVEDGVDDVPHVGLAGPPAGSDGREVRLDQGPLLVGDVAGVVVRSHPPSTSLGTLMGQSLRGYPESYAALLFGYLKGAGFRFSSGASLLSISPIALIRTHASLDSGNHS